MTEFQILLEFGTQVEFSQDEYLIQQLYLFINEDWSEDVLTVTTCSKGELFFIFLNSKPAGGTVELSDGKSYYVDIYLYDNFDPDLRRDCVSETMLFCLKGQKQCYFAYKIDKYFLTPNNSLSSPYDSDV
ncbi:Hypothetical_protein [Hexamita inflata]|uniref:Hypothetical_protein n=1 Tax=Hexamita inflata TaxID=28002 RepID=A0AA86NLX3_9EUKA|nr:Hypothetical protein HINF_LOCUS10000 [Hexamita inflata]